MAPKTAAQPKPKQSRPEGGDIEQLAFDTPPAGPKERILDQVKRFDRFLRGGASEGQRAQHTARLKPLPERDTYDAEGNWSGHEPAPASYWEKGVSNPAHPKMSAEMQKLADRLDGVGSPLELKHLYRGYKHTPHQPLATFLKYLVHRINHLDAYEDPHEASRLDGQFQNLVQQTAAGPNPKNGHVAMQDLHRWLRLHPKLVDQLIQHRDELQKDVLGGIGLNVRTINGEPYVALTRGLKSDLMTHEHPLSSHADEPEPPFGTVKHHAWVPVKDLWYSFDRGPKFASGNMGPEEEWLVSNQGPRYEATRDDVKASWYRYVTSRHWHDLEKTGEQPLWKPVLVENTPDAHLAQHLANAGREMPADKLYDLTHQTLRHPNAGPETWGVVQQLLPRLPKYPDPSLLSEHWLDKRAVPAEVALDQFNHSLMQPDSTGHWHSKRMNEAVRNPNLTADHLHSIVGSLGPQHLGNFQGGGYGSSLVTHTLLGAPNANHTHADLLWQRLGQMPPSNLSPDVDPRIQWGRAVLESPLAGRHILDEAVGLLARPTRYPDQHGRIDAAWGLLKNPNLTAEQGDRVLQTLYGSIPNGIHEVFGKTYAPNNGRFSDNAIKTMVDAASQGDTSAHDFLTRSMHEGQGITESQMHLVLDQMPQMAIRLAERRGHLPETVQHRLIDALGDGIRRGGMHLMEYQTALHQLASRDDLTESTVKALFNHPGGSAAEKVALNKKVPVEWLEAAWPKGVRSFEDWRNNGYKEGDERLEGRGRALNMRRDYERRRQTEHFIRPFPQGLWKSDDWGVLSREWLSQRQREASQGRYMMAVPADEAVRMQRERTIWPQPSEDVLEGHVVLAHPFSTEVQHAWEQNPANGDCLVSFEVDDHPERTDDGRCYWDHQLAVRNVTVLGDRTLQKAQTPFTFPKLGLGDNRREAYIVDTPTQLRTKTRALANATAHDAPHMMARAGASNATEYGDIAERAQGQMPPGFVYPGPGAGAKFNFGAVQSDKMRDVTFKDSFRPREWNPAQDGKGVLATTQHENGHMMFNRVQAKYGVAGRRKLVEHLLSAIPQEHRAQWDDFMSGRLGSFDRMNDWRSFGPEEQVSMLLNYLNNPRERDLFIKHRGYDAAQRWRIDQAMKASHRAMQQAAAAVGPEFFGGMPVGKSEESDLNLPGEEAGLEPGEHETIMAMLGHNKEAERCLSAAQFLVGHKQDVDLDAFRMAMSVHAGDMERAALYAVGLTDSAENLKALRGAKVLMPRSEGLKKAEAPAHAIVIQSVQPGNEDAVEVAKEIQRAAQARRVMPLKLNGKHSKGAQAARDSQTGHLWLLKVGAGKQSPAAGARDDTASQSRREAAFYAVAEQVGLQGIVPEARLLIINAQEWAAIKLLGQGYKTLDEKNREEDQYARRVLTPYLRNGLLARFAILDWVLGQTDRHGQNVMVGPGGSVSLIDHGAAFAGDNFDPAHDTNSFIPYYLRVWTTQDDFKQVKPEDRTRRMPTLPEREDEVVREWVLKQWRPEVIQRTIARYGIDPKPTMKRLAEVQAVAKRGENISAFVNAKWAGVAPS